MLVQHPSPFNLVNQNCAGYKKMSAKRFVFLLKIE